MIERWLRLVCVVLGHRPRTVILTEEVRLQIPPGLIEEPNGLIWGRPTVPGTYSRYKDGTWSRRESSNGQRLIQCHRCGDTLYFPSPGLSVHPGLVSELVILPDQEPATE